ncbi:MAG: hypothetical protein KDF60_17885 [Calditrichaeota bacterium]|nr:hypothetical protein [Calditrichota bacterium]
MLKFILSVCVIIYLFGTPLMAMSDDEGDCSAEGCHASLLDFENVHDAAEDCSSCHESSGKAHPENPGKEFSLTTAMPLLCFDCHDQSEQITNRTHGPANESTPCLSCHNPHASNFSALLKQDEADLCFHCHNTEIDFEKRTIPEIASRVLESEFVHSPVEDGCSDCHASHSPEYALLEGAFPASNYGENSTESYGLCFDCHDDANIFSEKGSDTAFRVDGVNLHFVHVAQDKSRSCINCHNVHGADFEHLVAGSVYFGKWNMPLGFQDNDRERSCLTGCHELKSYNGE